MASVIVAGDYSPKDRISELISKGQTEDIFSDIKGILSKADYSIVNFESTVISDKSKITQASTIACSSLIVLISAIVMQ